MTAGRFVTILMFLGASTVQTSARACSGDACVRDGKGDATRDHVLLQTRPAVLATKSTVSCCDNCAGHSFCSPRSRNCYGAKNKDYYETCTRGSQPNVPSPGPSPNAGKLIEIMSYNTQYNNYGHRVRGYGQKIAEVGPTVVGTQECQDKHSLASMSGYHVVPGTDFQNPIFYRPAVVTYVHGSSGWMPIPRDNYSPRTLTWAKFKIGGSELLLFNTHLPHNHGEARDKNTHARIAQMLLQKRRELGAAHIATVVTGDMNTFASHGASRGSFESNLVAAGFAKSYQARGNLGGHGGLDQIFHTAGHFTKVHGADHGTGGSDHPAITAELRLNV